MERSGGSAVPGTVALGRAPGGDVSKDDPAIRDAAKILARIVADDAAADEARERYRIGPLPSLDADPGTAVQLEPGEHIVAIRESVFLDRREPRPDLNALAGVAGTLYVTTRRLLLLGRIRLSIDLAEIEDVAVSGERLLLVLRDARGVSLETARPRLLRVELAAARAALRT
ncbi:MAG: hypothetical protein ABI573_11085 [Chloroflexota bacterium]